MYELKKIGIFKRASAWLLDAILFMVLATGVMYIVSLICDYSSEAELASQYSTEWNEFYENYIAEVAEFYGFTYEKDGATYTITKNGQASSLSEVVTVLYNSKGLDEQTAEAYEAYCNLTPAATVDLQNQLVSNLLFIIISVGILLAYLILEFVVPLFFKNGQTVGKKVFGICLVRTDCVKITNLALFARTVIGKFAVETMFPILLVFLSFTGVLGMLGLILFAALFVLNAVLFFATKNKTPIHDIFAGTVAVDKSIQVIFQSEEELIEKKTLQFK